jgi:hypothetical protein
MPHAVCTRREKLRAAALAVLPVDQLPGEEVAVAHTHVDARDLPKAGEGQE